MVSFHGHAVTMLINHNYDDYSIVHTNAQALMHHQLIIRLGVLHNITQISSVESQKGVSAVQRYSTENQKGTIAYPPTLKSKK